MTRVPLQRWLLPVSVVVVAVIATVWLIDRDGVGEPEYIAANGPRFGTVAEVVAASDVIVVGRVGEVSTGRTLTDPTDAEAGIVTQLASVEVESVLVGDTGRSLVLEQEVGLLDGTPIVVNGLPALVEGDEGVFFLVSGDTDDFPFTALVNEQGWVARSGGDVLAVVDGDDLWSDWEGRAFDDLVVALRSAVDAGAD